MIQQQPENMENELWNDEVKTAQYSGGEQYQEHVLEQYKLYVEMADRISSRRSTANTFFISINTFFIGAIGLLQENEIFDQYSPIFIPFLLAAIILCYVWLRLVISYRQLNTAKYIIIGQLEERLPASPYWKAEWSALGQGKDCRKYTPLTHVETWVPVVFMLLYVVAGIVTLAGDHLI